MLDKVPTFLKVKATIEADFTCKTNFFEGRSSYAYYISVNIKYGFVQVYYHESSKDTNLSTKGAYPCRESQFGLQFFYDDKWEVLCTEVQEHYARYKLEKEIEK